MRISDCSSDVCSSDLRVLPWFAYSPPSPTPGRPLPEDWPMIPPAFVLAVLTTLAGNFILIGSLANLIVVERAASVGVKLGFLEQIGRASCVERVCQYV